MTAAHGAGPVGPQHVNAICHLCNRNGRPAVVVGVVHGDAGPGRTMYAHQDCMDARRRRQSSARGWLR